MSIPPPLIAATEPVPRPEAGGTAPEDTGTFSLTLCTCQSPRPETGATVPKQPMAQEVPAGSPGPHLPHTLPPPRGWPPGVVSGSLRISKTSPPSHLLSSATCKSTCYPLPLVSLLLSLPRLALHEVPLRAAPGQSPLPGPPTPRPSLIGTVGVHQIPKHISFWGQNTKLVHTAKCL